MLPVYSGVFRWGHKLYEGRHEPLISKVTFDRVQKVLDGRRNSPKGRVHEFTFTGLIRCGRCGGLLSGDLKKRRYVYYSCGGTKGCRRFYPEKLFEGETLNLLAAIQIDQSVSESILQELETMEENHSVDEKQLKRLVARRKELQEPRTRAYEEKPPYWGRSMRRSGRNVVPHGSARSPRLRSNWEQPSWRRQKTTYWQRLAALSNSCKPVADTLGEESSRRLPVPKATPSVGRGPPAR